MLLDKSNKLVWVVRIRSVALFSEKMAAFLPRGCPVDPTKPFKIFVPEADEIRNAGLRRLVVLKGISNGDPLSVKKLLGLLGGAWGFFNAEEVVLPGGVLAVATFEGPLSGYHLRPTGPVFLCNDLYTPPGAVIDCGFCGGGWAVGFVEPPDVHKPTSAWPFNFPTRQPAVE